MSLYLSCCNTSFIWVSEMWDTAWRPRSSWPYFVPSRRTRNQKDRVGSEKSQPITTSVSSNRMKSNLMLSVRLYLAAVRVSFSADWETNNPIRLCLACSSSSLNTSVLPNFTATSSALSKASPALTRMSTASTWLCFTATLSGLQFSPNSKELALENEQQMEDRISVLPTFAAWQRTHW